MTKSLMRLLARQHVSNLIDPPKTDRLIDKQIIYNLTNTKKDIQRYLQEKDMLFRYPAKSYVVAACYACWLKSLVELYGERISIEELLERNDLLFGNDDYFTIYSRSKKLYDFILNEMKNQTTTESGIVPEIFNYFCQEFKLNEKEKSYLTSKPLICM